MNHFSGWYGPLCVKIDQWDTGQDSRAYEWCQFLLTRGDTCETYAPSTKEKANNDLKRFLEWKYTNTIKNYFKHNRWSFQYNIETDFKGPGTRFKCGSIGAKGAPPKVNKDPYAMNLDGGRKKRKQTKRHKKHGRKTRRHSK